MFDPYVKYLSVRDKGGFESETLLAMIDQNLIASDKSFHALRKEYRKRYHNFREKSAELAKIKEDEAKLAELIEFATYEIEKIAKIDPQIGEEEELFRVKQQLSRIDKIQEALSKASNIFTIEPSVEEVYKLLDKDGDFFSDAMNQLRADFEETQNLADELSEVNVEEVLDRLSDLTSLKNRYGSIEEAIAYKALKEKELAGYQTIEKDKTLLESFLQIEFSELMILATRSSQIRQKEAIKVEEEIQKYLEVLKLPTLQFVFGSTGLSENGTDSIDVMLGNSTTSTLSGGEFNRLRLALMATMIPETKKKQGVLILDEIDANVSGDESIAIAEMIQNLAKVYQVFAISHQPHLSAKATQHIVVKKEDDKSYVKILDEEARIVEIARIVGGENATSEAIEFAKKLRA
jgi:DNA repair protein RecN (Recombination protein N)